MLYRGVGVCAYLLHHGGQFPDKQPCEDSLLIKGTKAGPHEYR